MAYLVPLVAELSVAVWLLVRARHKKGLDANDVEAHFTWPQSAA